MGSHQAPTARQDDDDTVRPDVAALYQQHKDAMYAVARRMLLGDHRQRAEDVVQDVMVSLLSRPPVGVRNWEAFLVHMVKMKILDLWKSATYRHETELLDGVIEVEHGLVVDDLGVDPAVVIEEVLERVATVAEVRAALAELDRRDPSAADVFRQVKELGRTSRDVAAELGVSDARVRQLVMRARQELMNILDSKGGRP